MFPTVYRDPFQLFEYVRFLGRRAREQEWIFRKSELLSYLDFLWILVRPLTFCHASLDQLKSAIPPAEERKKLVPLALMFFCILFNYTILRDTKDVLMVTAPKSGAEGRWIMSQKACRKSPSAADALNFHL